MNDYLKRKNNFKEKYNKYTQNIEEDLNNLNSLNFESECYMKIYIDNIDQKDRS